MAIGDDTIVSGGLSFPAAWLQCQAAASGNPEEAFVRVRSTGISEALAFLVDRELVSPSPLPDAGEIHGRVKVLLVELGDDVALVEVPGDPLSFGPKIRVSAEELAGSA